MVLETNKLIYVKASHFKQHTCSSGFFYLLHQQGYHTKILVFSQFQSNQDTGIRFNLQAGPIFQLSLEASNQPLPITWDI